MIRDCPWCGEFYDLTKETEWPHLRQCLVFQTLPVAEVKNGKTFIALPSNPDILVERIRIQ